MLNASNMIFPSRIMCQGVTCYYSSSPTPDSSPGTTFHVSHTVPNMTLSNFPSMFPHLLDSYSKSLSKSKSIFALGAPIMSLRLLFCSENRDFFSRYNGSHVFALLSGNPHFLASIVCRVYIRSDSSY